jgi:hypothetical protein
MTQASDTSKWLTPGSPLPKQVSPTSYTAYCEANAYYNATANVTVCVGALLAAADAGSLQINGGTWGPIVWNICIDYCVNTMGTPGGNLMSTTGGFECWCKGAASSSGTYSCLTKMFFYQGEPAAWIPTGLFRQW